MVKKMLAICTPLGACWPDGLIESHLPKLGGLETERTGRSPENWARLVSASIATLRNHWVS